MSADNGDDSKVDHAELSREHSTRALELAMRGEQAAAIAEYKIAFEEFMLSQWIKRAHNHMGSGEYLSELLSDTDAYYRVADWHERIILIDSLRGLIALYEYHLAAEFGFSADSKGNA